MKNLSKMTAATLALGRTASTAAASSAYSDKIDMADFSGCLFTAAFQSSAASTGTATFSIKGSTSSTAGSSAYSVINGASITIPKSTSATSKRWAAIDIYLPKYRYLKALVNRKQMIGVNAVLAQRYAPKYMPTTPGSTTIATATVAAGNVLVVAGT